MRLSQKHPETHERTSDACSSGPLERVPGRTIVTMTVERTHDLSQLGSCELPNTENSGDVRDVTRVSNSTWKLSRCSLPLPLYPDPPAWVSSLDAPQPTTMWDLQPQDPDLYLASRTLIQDGPSSYTWRYSLTNLCPPGGTPGLLVLPVLSPALCEGLAHLHVEILRCHSGGSVDARDRKIR